MSLHWMHLMHTRWRITDKRVEWRWSRIVERLAHTMFVSTTVTGFKQHSTNIESNLTSGNITTSSRCTSRWADQLTSCRITTGWVTLLRQTQLLSLCVEYFWWHSHVYFMIWLSPTQPYILNDYWKHRLYWTSVCIRTNQRHLIELVWEAVRFDKCEMDVYLPTGVKGFWPQSHCSPLSITPLPQYAVESNRVVGMFF